MDGAYGPRRRVLSLPRIVFVDKPIEVANFPEHNAPFENVDLAKTVLEFRTE